MSNHATALVITSVAVAAASLALVFTASMQPPVPSDLIISYSDFDSTGQRLAHKVLLCVLAVLGLLSPWLRTAFGRLLGPARTATVNGFCSRLFNLPLALALPLLPFFLWVYRGPGRDQYRLGMAVFALVLLLGQKACGNKLLRACCGGLLVLFGGFLLLPGFLGTYTFGSALEPVLMHYYGMFGLAPLLASGSAPLANSQIFYGILAQTVLAIGQQGAALLQMGDYVLLVQISQVVFAAAALLGYRVLAPGRPLWALFCACLWLPWISTAGGAIMAPTQSGLRFMNFALATLALLLVERLSRRAQASVLGVLAGLALLLNLETGICITLAFCMHCILAERARDLGAMARRLLLLLLGCLASVGAFLLVFRFGLGRWPFLAMDKVLGFIKLFSGGFGGLPLYFDPLALVLILYPAYLIVRLTGIWLRTGLTPRMRFKFLVSFIILLWLAYYFNRVHRWNLWSHTFLFTFLILDLLPKPLDLRAGWSGFAAAGRRRIPALAFVLIFILGPACMRGGLSEATQIWKSTAQRLALERDPAGVERLSGLWIETPCAEDIRAKSAFIREIPPSRGLFFAGANVFLLQLQTGRFFPLPAQDLLIESTSVAALEFNVAALEAYAPEVLLLGDGAACPGSFSQRGPFAEYLAARLGANYTRTRSASGWLVLERKGSPAAL